MDEQDQGCGIRSARLKVLHGAFADCVGMGRIRMSVLELLCLLGERGFDSPDFSGHEQFAAAKGDNNDNQCDKEDNTAEPVPPAEHYDLFRPPIHAGTWNGKLQVSIRFHIWDIHYVESWQRIKPPFPAPPTPSGASYNSIKLNHVHHRWRA